MLARTLDGQLDQIINIIETELILPGKALLINQGYYLNANRNRNTSKSKDNKLAMLVDFACQQVDLLNASVNDLNSRNVSKVLTRLERILSTFSPDVCRDNSGKKEFYLKTNDHVRDDRTENFVLELFHNTKQTVLSNALESSNLLKNFATKLRGFKPKLLDSLLLDYADQASVTHFYLSTLNASSSRQLFASMRKNCFSEPHYEINSDDVQGSVEFMLLPQTRFDFFQYLEAIKSNIRNKKLNLEADYSGDTIIGYYLFNQLKKYATNNNILDMRLDEFLICLIKTTITNLKTTNANHDFIRNWNSQEYNLLANMPKLIKNATLLTNKIDKPTKKNISDEKPTFNAVFINTIDLHNPFDLEKIITNFDSLLDFHKWDEGKKTEQIKARFSYLNFKKILTQRFLPALIQLNAMHTEGFVFVLQGDAFVGEDSWLCKKFLFALQNMIKEHQALLPHLKGVISSHVSYNRDEIDDINCVNGRSIPFIVTKHAVAPTQSYVEFVLNQFACKLPRLQHYAITTGLASHACTRVGYEVNPDKPEVRPGQLMRCTTLFTEATGVEGQLMANKDSLISYQPLQGVWKNKFDDQAIPIKKVNILGLKNEAVSTSFISPFEHLYRVTSPLYNQAYSLIHSVDFDYDEIKKARLCAIYQTMSNSENRDDKWFANKMQPYFTVDLLDKYKRNYPQIMAVQDCLLKLSNIETQKVSQKNEIIRYLTHILDDKIDINLHHFDSQLQKISKGLKSAEWFSFFGHHNLRYFIDEFRDELKKNYNLTPQEKHIDTSRYYFKR